MTFGRLCIIGLGRRAFILWNVIDVTFDRENEKPVIVRHRRFVERSVPWDNAIDEILNVVEAIQGAPIIPYGAHGCLPAPVLDSGTSKKNLS
jgi:hypothetical protein